MSEQAYVCPMHTEVRQPHVGTCPTCGMDVVPEGARFAMLRHMMNMPRHMITNPLVLIVMVAAMAVMPVMMMRYSASPAQGGPRS